MDYRFATTQDREALAGLVVDAAEEVSLRLTPFELASSPAAFRRSDATSVFRPKNSTIYSSHQLLDAEDRLLQRSHETTGPTVGLETMERIARRPDPDGRVLGEDQAEALVRIAVSGRILDVLVGPAGAGKTTAMNALRRAWEREHGAGSVVGLAPSAGAAQVLPRTWASRRRTRRNGGRPTGPPAPRSTPGNSSSWTKPRSRARSPLTESPASQPKKARRYCWSATARNSSPSMQEEHSDSLSMSEAMPPN